MILAILGSNSKALGQMFRLLAHTPHNWNTGFGLMIVVTRTTSTVATTRSIFPLKQMVEPRHTFLYTTILAAGQTADMTMTQTMTAISTSIGAQRIPLMERIPINGGTSGSRIHIREMKVSWTISNSRSIGRQVQGLPTSTTTARPGAASRRKR